MAKEYDQLNQIPLLQLLSTAVYQLCSRYQVRSRVQHYAFVQDFHLTQDEIFLLMEELYRRAYRLCYGNLPQVFSSRGGELGS